MKTAQASKNVGSQIIKIILLLVKTFTIQIGLCFLLFFVGFGIGKVFGHHVGSGSSNWLIIFLMALIVYILPVISIKSFARSIRLIISFICIIPAVFLSFTILVNVAFAFPTIKKTSAIELTKDDLVKQFQGEINIIQSALPSNWKILTIEKANDVPWVFVSSYNGLEIKAYGPQIGSRTYYDGKGHTVSVPYMNEGRKIWVMPGNFNPNWNYLNWTFASFNLNPIEFPEQIVCDRRLMIYAQDAVVILPENQEKSMKTPEGFIGSKGCQMPLNGGSWPNWRDNIKKQFTESGYKTK